MSFLNILLSCCFYIRHKVSQSEYSCRQYIFCPLPFSPSLTISGLVSSTDDGLAAFWAIACWDRGRIFFLGGGIFFEKIGIVVVKCIVKTSFSIFSSIEFLHTFKKNPKQCDIAKKQSAFPRSATRIGSNNRLKSGHTTQAMFAS